MAGGERHYEHRQSGKHEGVRGGRGEVRGRGVGH